jgi:dihydrolipoamide dehydrogenase
LIEKEHLGGTCLNVGCIPTKTLIAGTEVLETVENAATFGVKVSGKISADWKAMQARKNDVVSKLRGGIAGLMKAYGVEVVKGNAKFISRKTVSAAGTKIAADKFIIASGAEPAVPGFIPKSKRVITSTELLSITTIPKSLLVLGGGVVGCEFASIFSALGSKVTIVEMMPNILPGLDKDLAATLTKELSEKGVEILVGKPMENIKADAKSVSGKVGTKKLSADYLLVSVGRKPVAAELAPENAGVEMDDKGFIPVDDNCATNAPGIFAVGDVTGRIQLAHMASAMGWRAAEIANGVREKPPRFDLVPGCVFTNPEIGTVGLAEEQCEEDGLEYNVGKFAFAGLGKALAAGDTTGFCKIIADKNTDQVLGVHIVGPHATELIAEAATAMNLEITAKELGKAIHSHPTLAEAVMEAAHAVHGECLHAPPPRKRKK